MRELIILGAAASLLTLAACNREAETPAPAEEAAEPSGTAAPDPAATGAASGSTSTTGGAAASADTAWPAADAPPPPQTRPGPVTDATRAGAKEKAESTNLHPKTN